MNKSKVILAFKILFSAGFIISSIIAILNLKNGATVAKPYIFGSVVTGVLGLIISFIESGLLSKENSDLKKEAVISSNLAQEKDAEIASITKEVQDQTLLSERIAKLSRIIQEADDVNIASANILETIASDIEICQGVIYVTQEENGTKFLKGAGTYAYHKLESELDQPQFGVGLVGQTAQEKKSLFINELPNGYIDVVSGLGKAQPSYLALVPLMYSGEVLGVIELASFTEFTEKDKELFEGIKDVLGAGIHFLNQAKILEKLKSEITQLKSNEALNDEPLAIDAPIIEEEIIEDLDESIEDIEMEEPQDNNDVSGETEENDKNND